MKEEFRRLRPEPRSPQQGNPFYSRLPLCPLASSLTHFVSMFPGPGHTGTEGPHSVELGHVLNSASLAGHAFGCCVHWTCSPPGSRPLYCALTLFPQAQLLAESLWTVISSNSVTQSKTHLLPGSPPGLPNQCFFHPLCSHNHFSAGLLTILAYLSLRALLPTGVDTQ